MAKLCLKKKSKRIPAKRRYNVEKKVREHNRKVKKEAKKKAKVGKKKKRPVISIPNACPFKDDILREVSELKKKKEEERQRQRAQWKKEKEELKKLEKDSTTLETLVSNADVKQKIHEAFEPTEEEQALLIKKDGSMKAFYKEFKKVVEAADVVLEVLDARDPLGTRCQQVEQAVLDSLGHKRLVIVVNKADLVPRPILDKWLKYLRGSFPAVPFKASTQMQTRQLGRRKMAKSKHKVGPEVLQVSSCVGAELLMSLLANYCRNKAVKTSITVGVVGLPNVGKSSIINSLKRNRACKVGAVPGITKSMQVVQLDTKIKLLDSPGIVFAKSTGGMQDALVALKNAAKVDSLADPFPPACAILQRTTKKQMMEQYDIGDYQSPEEFFALKAKRQGKFKRGGVVDTDAAARGLIDDWNKGKIRYYTVPPETSDSNISSKIVMEMSKEFDIDSFETMEVEMLSELGQSDGPSFQVETTGIVEAQPMDDDAKDFLGSHIILPQLNKTKGVKRKLPNKENTPLVPVSNKKLQKALAKKARKESARREKETTSLAGVLSNFSLGEGSAGVSDNYTFATDFKIDD